MTPGELLQLNRPTLSHPARSLYYLQLRRQADEQGYVWLNYPELGRALAVEDAQADNGFSYQVNATQLTHLLDELQEAGLLQLLPAPHPGPHYHGRQAALPLSRSPVVPLAQPAFAMYAAWGPGSGFTELGRLCGLLDCQVDDEELGEFIAYWLGRPETFATEHQWMLKLIKALKARRYARAPRAPLVVNGFQQVSQPEPVSTRPSDRALQMMEEARRLGAQDTLGEQDEAVR